MIAYRRYCLHIPIDCCLLLANTIVFLLCIAPSCSILMELTLSCAQHVILDFAAAVCHVTSQSEIICCPEFRFEFDC